MVKIKKQSKRTPVRLRHKIEKASAAKQRKQRKEAKRNPQWRSRLKKDPGIPNLFPYKDRILHEIEEKRRLKDEDTARRREEARANKASQGGKAAQNENENEDDGAVSALPEQDEIISDDDMEEDGGDETKPMAALLASARARATEYNDQNGEDHFDGMDEDSEDSDGGGIGEHDDRSINYRFLATGSGTSKSKEFSRRAYDKIFKQVVSVADVVLYVLDARDPDGTRSKEIEREIMSADGGSKRLILILNKIDLVPPPVVKSWLVYLRRYFPSLPLRASNPAPNAQTFNHKQLTVKSTSETLLKALKSYAHTKQLKRAISVGVIGYPNVGKSSVINALTSRLHHRIASSSAAACPVGAEAGVTTFLREVKLDGKLKLLDSPGIVFPANSHTATLNANNTENIQRQDEPLDNEQARLVLLNAVPPKQIVDPVPAVSLLLSRLSKNPSQFSKLLEVYNLPPLLPSSPSSNDLITDFLIQVARKRGRLGKGGVPNLNSAAMAVITDWRDGRIQAWTEAPVIKVVLSQGPGSGSGSGSGSGPVATGSHDSDTTTTRDANALDMPLGADRKEIVKEWAQEFKLEGLWGDCDGNDDDDDNDEVMES